MTTETKTFLARASLNDILEVAGRIEKMDFADALEHVMKVAQLNNDDAAIVILANAMEAIIGKSESDVQHEVGEALQRLFIEFMAAGKEITLRKVCKMFDPEGNHITIPEDWKGRGQGVT